MPAMALVMSPCSQVLTGGHKRRQSLVIQRPVRRAVEEEDQGANRPQGWQQNTSSGHNGRPADQVLQCHACGPPHVRGDPHHQDNVCAPEGRAGQCDRLLSTSALPSDSDMHHDQQLAGSSWPAPAPPVQVAYAHCFCNGKGLHPSKTRFQGRRAFTASASAELRVVLLCAWTNKTWRLPYLHAATLRQEARAGNPDSSSHAQKHGSTRCGASTVMLCHVLAAHGQLLAHGTACAACRISSVHAQPCLH